MTTSRGALVALLVLFGAGWGLTQPLNVVAVSEGHRHAGLVFWNLTIGSILLGVVSTLRGRGLPLYRAAAIRYLVIALLGSFLPGLTSYQAAVHLPGGVLSILISTVPLFAFPVAIALGADSVRPGRILGLCLGFLGVLLLVVPEASLPERAMVAAIPLGLIAPLLYALEGNAVASLGRAGLDPVQLLWGASIVGAALALPTALLSGAWIDPRPPWGAPEAALVATAAIHVVVYAGYVWIVGRAGATFAAQVAYLVTGFGVIWSMLLLGERYSGWIWAALAAMLAGLALVQPRPALVPPAPARQDAR